MNDSRLEQVAPPSVIGAFLLLTVVHLSLRIAGFSRTTGLVRRLAGREPDRRVARPAAQRIAKRLVTAAVFYPGRALCLEQSLALYVLLRRRGVAAELRIGVQPYPFNAHAWIEVEGSPLNESIETTRQFVTVQEFAL